ncbi:MAG: 50S ribosomal protein L30 [Thermoplasmata archaeon]|nr:MAG: 50S ribosomal protein L30 [Thermoplasmata archaeon]MCD6468306.1 50S ribosomal protein L30 [Thermoplasmata archaeon]RLF27157.1 MAG: 50S ribosomal protein L30 [Thermoplasmata archaeon]
MTVYGVVRVRGNINVKPEIKKTLQMLRLTRVNHCVLVEDTPSYKGMLNRVKDYVTWGEINQEVLAELIKSHGRIEGDKPVTDEYIGSATSYKSIDELSAAIVGGSIRYQELPNIKPVFRLNPPKGGYEGIKRSFKNKGALGYRGDKINDLMRRML